VTAWIALSLLAATGHAAEPAHEPVTAVWKERLLHFSYRGYSAVYPCKVLENRVALVLAAVGARPDIEVDANQCDTSVTSATVAPGEGADWTRTMPGTAPGYPGTASGPSANRIPRDGSAPGGGYYRRTEPRQEVDMRVRLSVPVEVTPAVIEELKTDRKRRELLARVTDDPLPLFDDPVPFTAQRQVLTLSRETGIEAVDCELVDQMASSLFKDLGVRVLKRNNRCDRGTVSRIPPKVTVEALVPVRIGTPGPAAAAPEEDAP